MRFTIPQFIEHEAKIVGPLTFKQFTYLAAAGTICFFLYFLAPKWIFFLACIVLGGIASAFAFLNVNGMPLPSYIANFLKFSLSPKMYLWKKQESKKVVLVENKTKKEIPEDELPLKIEGKSRLKDKKTEIETKKPGAATREIEF